MPREPASVQEVDQPAQIAIFAPSPILTITVEAGASGDDEIHLHAGGQGFWVARMAAILGGEVTLCAALGGESGRVLRALIPSSGPMLRAIPATGANGAYVHDRRRGGRERVAAVPSPRLQRHEIDELFGAMVASGLGSQVAVLTGTEHDEVLPAEVYGRLAGDLRRNGVPVIADLTGKPLASVLVAGVDLLKLSHEELGLITSRPLDSAPRLVEEMRSLHTRGADNVLISRAEEPALAVIGGEVLELSGPRFEPVDYHGAGDSMFAAVAVGIARRLALPEVLKLAVAAGALNVTRHGLGSGQRRDIERLADTLHVRRLQPSTAAQRGATGKLAS